MSRQDEAHRPLPKWAGKSRGIRTSWKLPTASNSKVWMGADDGINTDYEVPSYHRRIVLATWPRGMPVQQVI